MAAHTPRQKLVQLEKIARSAFVSSLESQEALDGARERAKTAQRQLRAAEAEERLQAVFVMEVEEQVSQHRARHAL